MPTQGQSLYNVDVVFCIDATGSMEPHISRVKENALKFHSDLVDLCKLKGKIIDKLRIKVVVFRDFYEDNEPLIISSFYKLPEDISAYRDFVKGIIASGGGDEPESGLEALAEAINSDWQKNGAKKRHVVVVFTDASAHPLERKGKKDNYPSGMPEDLMELTNMWESKMNNSAKRLILFTPDGYGWSQVEEHWTNTIHHSAQAAEGLKEQDYKSILSVIASSV